MDSKKEVKRLLKSLKRDFGNWNKDGVNVQYFLREPNEHLTAYAREGDTETLVQLEVSRLHTWNLTLYAAAALNDSRHPLDELAIAAKYAAWRVLIGEPRARINRGGSVLKDHAAFAFSLQFLCGWKRRALAVGNALIEGLDTPLLDLRINDRHDAGSLYPHFWFLMHLFRSANNHAPIDTALYSYPESMAPYDLVLADWRSTDLAKVQQFVIQMAEHHVQMTDDSDPDAKKEFDNPDYQLFPYEILAFLRLREWMGLANPTEFDHPLMQQPLAFLPPTVPLPDPATPLLDQVIARYRQEFPDLREPDGI